MLSLTKKSSAIGLAILAVLGTGGVRVLIHDDKPSVHYPKAWDARVLPLIRFVEDKRGLTFKHPVPVEFLDDAAFDKQVAVPAPESKKDKQQLATAVGTFRALGLLRGDVDLVKQLDTLHKASIIGLYVPEKHAVFVRGTTLDPYRKGTLVHELTHVLQDQYFDIQKLQDDAPGGDSTGVTALIEGDAVRIEEQYKKQLSAADTRLFDAAEKKAQASGSAAQDVPEVLQDLLGFPYIFGPVLLESLTQVDGNKAVDRAFRNPPSEEAQIVDPVGHPLTEEPRKVATPQVPAGAKKVDDVGPFGQVSLFLVLGGRLGYTDAWKAVADWKGDAYVPYTQGGRTCVAVDVAMGSTSSTATFLAAAQTWAKALGATVAQSGDLVTVRSCDPGSTAPSFAETATSAFRVLSARQSIILEFMQHGSSYTTGRCVADSVITGLGAAHASDITTDDLPPARLAALKVLAQSANQTCRG